MQIEMISKAEADALLTVPGAEHYLGATTYYPRYCFANVERTAVAVYAPPVASSFKERLRPPTALHPKAKSTKNKPIPPKWEFPLELVRLYKAPGAKFRTSVFIAQTLAWLRTNTRVLCVFSYADPAQGHKGTVYQLTGFTYLGPSRPTDKWRTPEGKTVSSPQCYRQFTTKSREKIQALRPDWELIEGVSKHLYVFPLRMRVGPLLALMGGRYAKLRLVQGRLSAPPKDSEVRPLVAAPIPEVVA